MRLSATLICAVTCGIAAASADNWKSQQFKSLVTFGDSYTDESRLQYFEDNDGSPPPPTWVEPAVSSPLLVSFYSGGSVNRVRKKEQRYCLWRLHVG
jgi:hypothetical protein